ncbi:MAG: YARHG domain-containing protein [Spirochaetaceae bacterium]|jgi:hypothetical protein|nr:YARHG domain-containing protein [Spirochaetaceae bacterium]
MRRKIVVLAMLLYFVCAVQSVTAQEDPVTEPDKVASEYLHYFSNLGFSTCDIIMYNGYWDLYEAIRVFHELDIAVLDKKKLRLLRNAIYARHGLIFKSEDLRLWFSQFPWYKPQYTDVEDKLTMYDKINIKRIQAYENPAPNKKVTAADLIGEWEGTFPIAAGSVNRVIIYAGGGIEFEYNIMAQKITGMTKGTYRIEDGSLVVMITEQRLELGDILLKDGGL